MIQPTASRKRPLASGPSNPLGIRPTYRVPASEVRIPEELVEETGQYANRTAGSIRRSLALARPLRRS